MNTKTRWRKGRVTPSVTPFLYAGLMNGRFCRQVKQSYQQPFSRFAGTKQHEKCEEEIAKDDKGKKPSFWVPHHPTGIYFPQGHEKVMKDVPDGAASYSETFWFRNIDGVDKTDPDLSTT